MSERTEPTVSKIADVSEVTKGKGGISGLFGAKQPRAVSAILGGFNQLVQELKDTVKHHSEAVVKTNDEIEKLNAQNAARQEEIAGAEHAITNITALISPKAAE